MSQADPELGYSGYTFPFDSPEQASLVEHNNLFKSELAATLEVNGVAKVETDLSADDYATVAQHFSACLENCPELLKATWHLVDRRSGNDAGYIRKERKVNQQTGRQIQDPKNVFHFNEQARLRWEEQFRLAPVELRRFLDAGYEVHNALLRVARAAVVDQLEPTHPGITATVFPLHSPSVSFYRHVDYDAYDIGPDTAGLPVAIRHLDISWLTLQGNSTAPGFYGVDPAGNKVPYDEHNGSAYAFMGVGHRKLYGTESFIKPLLHGVDRITPPDTTHAERRKADILFLNPWKIDCGVRPSETKDY